MKKIGKIALIPVAVFVASLIIYWFNLDNKLIFFGVRPLLNRIYDSRERDVKL